MSEFVNFVVDSVSKSKFFFQNPKTLEVDNAVIIWKNFSGKANKWKNTARYFNLVITKDLADVLNNLIVDAKGNKVSFNVHKLVDHDTDEAQFYYIPVKVNMDSAFPPIITVYTDFNGNRSHNALNSETVGTLDSITFDSADLVLNISDSKVNPGHPSAYLKKLNVIHHKVVEFGGKYDDWDNGSQEPEKEELPEKEEETAPQSGDVALDNLPEKEDSEIDGEDEPKKKVTATKEKK
jgi:hypothetical protein